MKRVASCLAALAALGSTGVYAKTTRIRCTPHREIIRSGDTAMGLALRNGVDAAHFTAWVQKASPVTRQTLRHMRPGDVFDLCLASVGSTGKALMNIHLERNEVGRKRADQQTNSPEQPTSRSFANVTSEVVSTARTVATTLAAPAPAPWIKPLAPGHLLSNELTRLLGHHPVVATVIAYAREKWHLPARLPKDSRCTLALLPSDAPGSRRMRLVYLQLDYRGRRDRVYHYVDSQGHDFMVGAHGGGYRVLDPSQPVPAARISSGWGWRIQPVLGGDEFHKGIDYAAPTGTPVRATMDGVVDISGWHGGYGRMVEVRHSGDLATRYGHLSAFAAHVRLGSHVHRGQIIGYVGSSGLSTGPHLYYEIWERGKRINPLAHRQLMVATHLNPHERKRFVAYVSHIKAAP